MSKSSPNSAPTKKKAATPKAGAATETQTASRLDCSAESPAGPVHDLFDLDALRLTQDFASIVGVEKVLTNVPCRKPNRQEFFRVRAGAEWRLDTAILEDILERESYLVAPNMFSQLFEEIRPVCLRMVISRQGNLFLWALKLPDRDGRTNSWNESAIEAATYAEKRWARISSNMSAGSYDLNIATGDFPEPVWPELSLKAVITLCFRDRMIDSMDHPLAKSLRGAT